MLFRWLQELRLSSWFQGIGLKGHWDARELMPLPAYAAADAGCIALWWSVCQHTCRYCREM